MNLLTIVGVLPLISALLIAFIPSKNVKGADRNPGK